jgi:ribosomal-protein-alanine N-acetyltransferase
MNSQPDQAPRPPSWPTLKPPATANASSSLRLVPLPVIVLRALIHGDVAAASATAGVTLTPYFLEYRWLWEIRLSQIHRDPSAGDWVVRAAVDGEKVVGHVGFHGPPDERGMVEVAYSVDPEYRRRGYAKKMLATALTWAKQDPRVIVVRATVSPANDGSLATLAAFSFDLVGEQWDDEDGLELVYEWPLSGPRGVGSSASP